MRMDSFVDWQIEDILLILPTNFIETSVNEKTITQNLRENKFASKIKYFLRI